MCCPPAAAGPWAEDEQTQQGGKCGWYRPDYNICDICLSILSDSPGSHPEVFLDEVAGDGQRQEGDEDDGGNVGDDAESWHTQQGGAHETLEGGGDVLIDSVGVRGKPVEDAAKWRCLKQPGGKKNKVMSFALIISTVILKMK